MKKKIGTSKKSSMKKYAMAGEVSSGPGDLMDKAKGIAKKVANKAEEVGGKIYDKVKSKVPTSVKRNIQDVYGGVKKAAKVIDKTNFKKGGSVKKKK